MVKITYNPADGGAILVDGLEDQEEFIMENVGGALLPVVDEEMLEDRYLLVLPGDPEVPSGLYQLVKVDAKMEEGTAIFEAEK